ncbi:hypothetical protein PORY_002315 [Pneumocystis oryctolagi]|uniref:Uncharacterized protein n=1 Tax=Pneumocystis oryctolagi TaxID=42067 RepID=A0ACB7CA47_9ASCO|nr:hypothetical protein PORY_002315 [Pneumocystis oryctolagi]
MARTKDRRGLREVFLKYVRVIHRKNTPGDPNFLKISVACARVGVRARVRVRANGGRLSSGLRVRFLVGARAGRAGRPARPARGLGWSRAAVFLPEKRTIFLRWRLYSLALWHRLWFILRICLVPGGIFLKVWVLAHFCLVSDFASGLQFGRDFQKWGIEQRCFFLIRLYTTRKSRCYL